MSPENYVAFLVFAVFAVIIAVVLSSATAEQANQAVIDVWQIEAHAELEDRQGWDVTVLRRSGYEHGVWTVPGSRHDAISFAISKIAKAKITSVVIWRNSATILEVRASNDSTGQRRTSKYIGGFSIKPA